MTTLTDSLQERYPQLAFLCQMAHELPVVNNDNFEPPEDLNSLEGIYLYGLNINALEALREWLSQEMMRDVIVIEDDIAKLQGFLEHKASAEWILHPQVHLKMPFNHSIDQREFCRDCAKEFPLQRIGIYPAKSENQDQFEAFSLEIRRMTTLTHGRYCEYFYHYRLFENLLSNFKRFDRMFLIRHMKDLFKGRPAVVCGAGPSLTGVIEDLKQYRHKAVIFAGGSTIAALSNQGVQPHLALAVDPNPDEYPRLKASSAYTVPMIMGARVLPDIFNASVGDIGYMQSIACDISEYWVTEQLGIQGALLEEGMGEEALSVTTSCIALAEYMGCNPIVLAGVDLAFTGLEQYAKGVFTDSAIAIEEKKKDTRVCETLIEQQRETGETLYTNVKWLMEATCISQFSEKSKADFFNASDRGLKIEKIPYKPLKTILEAANVKPLYIDGFLQTAIHDAKVPEQCAETLPKALQELKTSLSNCQKHLTALLDALDLYREEFKIEGALFTLHEMDLQEELAYRCVLFGAIPSIEFAICRKERSCSPDALWRKKR
ncbi:MAG: DUF115 domain-containing protein, partial [Chlamydiia bacterium]|nr:DUF115 domain-containing protein [Chlamydiia bacterium]